MITTQVYCHVQIEGLHRWSGCPFEEVAYLRDLHRHVFHIIAHKPVFHDDRDTEFIMLKHQITQFLNDLFYDETYQLCNFGDMSCEMIGRYLMNEFQLYKVDVSEDGENGAVITNDNAITNQNNKGL